jgi:hypothetical protein
VDDPYLSPNVIIKSERIIHVGHVAHTGGNRNVYRVFVGNLNERDCLEHLYVDRRVIW